MHPTFPSYQAAQPTSNEVLSAMRKETSGLGRLATRDKYKSARNKALKLLREAKRTYFAGLKPNSKQFWKTVKLQTGNLSTIPTLKRGHVEASSDTDKATMLNEFFSECFNQSLPPLTTEDVACFRTRPDACPDELLCTEEEVLGLLTSLDTSKASGPDKISGRMLRSTANSIAPSVTKLFNLSIQDGTFPNIWKNFGVPESRDLLGTESLVSRAFESVVGRECLLQTAGELEDFLLSLWSRPLLVRWPLFGAVNYFELQVQA